MRVSAEQRQGRAWQCSVACGLSSHERAEAKARVGGPSGHGPNMGTTLQLPHAPGLKYVWPRPTDHRWRVIALLPPPEVEPYRAELIGSVFAAFISALGSRVADAREEAGAVRAGITGAKISTRRTRWIMAHERVKVRPHAIAPRQDSVGTLWWHEQDCSSFRHDILKYFDCWLHYGLC